MKNIFAENELPEPATAKEFLAVQTEGKRWIQRCPENHTTVGK